MRAACGHRLTRVARRRAHPGRGGECGQASLELLGLLPVVVAVALAAAQLLAVGYSRASAREALPGWSRADARVSVSAGEVGVELRPPTLLHALAHRLEVSASAR